MDILFNIKYYIKLLIAPSLKVNSSDTTPILYDSYNINDYYFIFNKNKVNIYSCTEVDKFIDKKIDPMTRQIIKHYQIVKIKYE